MNSATANHPRGTVILSDNPFDTPDATVLRDAKRLFLDEVIADISKAVTLTTALDVGCGVGLFSNHLSGCGLDVTAFDGRVENVEEAKKRTPSGRFVVCDVEDTSAMSSLGKFDFVLCFGLLYHLENPFLAIRNLAACTKSILLIETVIAPGKEPRTVLYEEEYLRNQGLQYSALIPTESWLLKVLYRAGFEFVYRTSISPDNPAFRPSITHSRRRTTLLASRVRLESNVLIDAPEPKAKRYIWDAAWIRGLGGSDWIRHSRRLLNWRHR